MPYYPILAQSKAFIQMTGSAHTSLKPGEAVLMEVTFYGGTTHLQ